MLKKINALVLIFAMVISHNNVSLAIESDNEEGFGCLSFLTSFFNPIEKSEFIEEELEAAKKELEGFDEFLPDTTTINDLSPEVLINILSNLDQKSLLSLKHTNRFFYQLVDNECRFQSKINISGKSDKFLQLHTLLTELKLYEKERISDVNKIHEIWNPLSETNFWGENHIVTYKKRKMGYEESLQRQKWQKANLWMKWNILKEMDFTYSSKIVACGWLVLLGTEFLHSTYYNYWLEQTDMLEFVLNPWLNVFVFSSIGTLSLVERYNFASGKNFPYSATTRILLKILDSFSIRCE